MNKNQNTTVVQKEWIDIIIDVFRFFAQHSTIEINGADKKVSVKYNGPSGYNMSFNVAALQNDNDIKVIEKGVRESKN